MTTELTKTNGAALSRNEEISVAIQPTTVAHALAAKEKAEIESAYIMAERHPRDWDDVRVQILKECQRPQFAETAIYEKPVGGSKIRGLSVRFAEAALRYIGNCRRGVRIIQDSPESRTVQVALLDLEKNNWYAADIEVEKTVERKSLKQGQTPLRVRQNSYGDIVYLVPATDDEIMQKQGALASKARRNLILEILPGWIQDEAKASLMKVRGAQIKDNPDAVKNKVVDGFATFGILPSQLAQYLGKPSLDGILPQEIEELRSVYQGIRDGEFTWADAFAEKHPDTESEGAAGTTEESGGTKRVKELIAKRTGKGTTHPPSTTEPAVAVTADAQEPPKATGKGTALFDK